MISLRSRKFILLKPFGIRFFFNIFFYFYKYAFLFYFLFRQSFNNFFYPSLCLYFFVLQKIYVITCLWEHKISRFANFAYSYQGVGKRYTDLTLSFFQLHLIFKSNVDNLFYRSKANRTLITHHFLRAGWYYSF